MDADPLFEHVARERAARGRAPGWRVSPPGAAARLFSDRDHGSPGGALDAAIAWRDTQRDPRSRVPIPAANVTLAPGVYLVAQRTRGRTYPVVKAVARDADGASRELVRSLLKHDPESALREAAEHRHRYRAQARDESESADAILTEALASYRAFVSDPSAHAEAP